MTACAPRAARTPLPAAAPSASRDWIDLQPGWRVRVVIPITRSGSFLPKLEPTRRSVVHGWPGSRGLSQANTRGAIPTTITASSDLLGYEVVLYSVRRNRGGELQVIFRTAVDKEGRKTLRQRRPIFRLFEVPAGMHYVRILHLTRSNTVNYDAAILASGSLRALDVFTKHIELHPAECRNAANVFCSWIPLGIAVIPERRQVRGHKRHWKAAY